MIRIKNNVMVSIWLSGAWLVVQMIVLVVMNARKSSYFSFGPSKQLVMPFTTDMLIDTWGKWCWLVLFSVVSTVVSVYNSAMLRPWIDSVALNPEVKLPHDKPRTLVLVNVSSAIQMATGAITFVYTSTQADMALFSSLSAVVVYYICSHEIVYDPDRDRLDSNDNSENIFQLDTLLATGPPQGEDSSSQDGLLLTAEQLKRVIDTSDFT